MHDPEKQSVYRFFRRLGGPKSNSQLSKGNPLLLILLLFNEHVPHKGYVQGFAPFTCMLLG